MNIHEATGIIGRDHPVSLLRLEVTRAVESHGGLVFITGEAGIGKTTLATWTAEQARQRGALVLNGVCWDSDRAPGYWPWTQILRGLRRAQPDITVETVSKPADGEDTVEPFHFYDSVTTALVTAAERQPIVVVLDDLHWADPASLKLLEFAAQHTWFERILFVGTYRDAEVTAEEHLLPMLAKATTITLTGLDQQEVAALIARTAGREPDPGLVAEVHRRTGGNPFFVEQTARLWGTDGSATAIAPGVREAVRRRLEQLPPTAVDLLTAASVLGREVNRQVLAAYVATPVAQVDRLLDRAITARLIVNLGGGQFTFAHDLVRETLYDGLSEADRRSRHASVITTIDGSAALAQRLFPADLARHAYLADGELPTSRAVDYLLAAARDASSRLAGEEAMGHFRRALEICDDPVRVGRIALEFGMELHHSGRKDEAWRYFRRAAEAARTHDDAELLAHSAITHYRYRASNGGMTPALHDLLFEAHQRIAGGAEASAPYDRIVQDLIAGAEEHARRGDDDEALTFSLWARHDTIWGLGTAKERVAITDEMREVAQRTGDRDSEVYAASLRWVALLEQGDPRYADQMTEFVSLAGSYDTPRYALSSAIDRQIISVFRGEFDRAATLLDEVDVLADHAHVEHASLCHHLRWAMLLLQGRLDEVDGLLGPEAPGENRNLDLLRAVTAVERGDVEAALRHIALVDAGISYARHMGPLWLRLLAQAGAAARDPELCRRAREALTPHCGEWTVSLFGCDISGPVDLWVATVDAAVGRQEEAVAGFRRAVEAAERLKAKPWSVLARMALASALPAQHGEEIAAAAQADAAKLGMRQFQKIAQRERDTTVEDEFRFDGTVWRLGYAGLLVHLPDAKGLHDLHTLLSMPGRDISAVELLDPAAGPELAAARRMGGDPVLDEEAKQSYKRRLSELDDEIDRAALRGNAALTKALEAEREALLHELRAAAGLAGRTRRLGDEAERARKTVTARIRDVLRKLDQRHPRLAGHLRETVSTGSTCAYAPSDPVDWVL